MATSSVNNLIEDRGLIRPNGTFRQYGGIGNNGETENFTIDLDIRRTTNGAIVNTIVNGEPLITTTA